MTAYLETQLHQIRIERAGRTVLKDIDWIIRPGQRWVLLGGNGAGKTQLLKVVAGSVWPAPTRRASRRYLWRGEQWTDPYGIQEEIAYLGAERQDKYTRYDWNHRVRNVVGTGLHRTDIPLSPLTPHDDRRVRKLLDRFGLSALADRRFLNLSYGERRLTLLARALAASPKLLLLDEVFNGLDESFRAQVLRWLNGSAKSALPWVLSTHRTDEIPRTATHALILDRGRAIYTGPVAQAPIDRWLSGAEPKPAASSPVKNHRRRIGRPPTLLLQLNNASIYLDGSHIVKNISLEVRSGECWVVHGANGSGKTTLLRALYGDHGIYGGVFRDGIEPGVPLEYFKRAVGWIAPHLQADHPLDMRVEEAVQSGRYASIGLNSPPTLADKAAAQRSLKALGLGKLSGRALGELSYGQLRRVLFARAGVRKTRLLLLDEPFSGIDTPTRCALLEYITTTVRQGTAVVMATHHRNEWPGATTHELQLLRGRAAYCGPVRNRSGAGG